MEGLWSERSRPDKTRHMDGGLPCTDQPAPSRKQKYFVVTKWRIQHVVKLEPLPMIHIVHPLLGLMAMH